MNAATNPDALKTLQAQIYRDKVLRARTMTPDERLAEARELSNDIYAWMLGCANAQCSLPFYDDGRTEVQRRLQTLRRLHEHKLYKPVAA